MVRGWVMCSLRFLLTYVLTGANVGLGAEVELAGIFGSKAILVVDGGRPQTLGAGDEAHGVTVVAVSGDSAVVEVDGTRRRLVLGQSPVRAASPGSGPSSVHLFPDERGHYFSSGTINHAPVRFLVDTGASMVSLGASDARRAGIEYRRGARARTQTANGPATVWQVRLDSVRVGDIALQGVDGLVHENDLPFVLLGMSFLNRMEMDHEGTRLVLRKRY